MFSDAETSSLRARYSGSSLRPRWPSVWFWTRRRTSSRASLPNRTTWNGSATCRALGTAALNAARYGPERPQHRPADSRAPAAGPPKQPPGRRFGGSGSHYVQELAASDVDDAAAPGLGPEPAPAHHQVLVEAQRRHSRDPLGVSVEQRGTPAPDRRVDGVPPTAQLRGDVFERAAPPGLACRPPRRAGRQQRPRRRDLRRLLSGAARLAAAAGAAPAALVPHQPHRAAERGEVHQRHRSLPVGPQRPAAPPTRRSRHPTADAHPQRRTLLVVDAEHLDIAQSHQQLAHARRGRTPQGSSMARHR